LLPTQIGTDDDDGSPINELTVNWRGVKHRKLGGRPNQRELRFLEALNEALLERGVMTQPAPGYPTVKAVVETHVREWFFSHYPPAGGNEKKRLGAASKAYTRAAADLCARKKVVSLTVGRDADARTLLWRVKDDDEQQHHYEADATPAKYAVTGASIDVCEHCGRTDETVLMIRNPNSASSHSLHEACAEQFYAEQHGQVSVED
jgi:hypothetical protein